MDIIIAIEHFFLMRHLKTLVKQGFHHEEKIIDHLEMLVFQFRNEFTEDNKATQDDFLEKCLKKALQK